MDVLRKEPLLKSLSLRLLWTIADGGRIPMCSFGLIKVFPGGCICFGDHLECLTFMQQECFGLLVGYKYSSGTL